MIRSLRRACDIVGGIFAGLIWQSIWPDKKTKR